MPSNDDDDNNDDETILFAGIRSYKFINLTALLKDFLILFGYRPTMFNVSTVDSSPSIKLQTCDSIFTGTSIQSITVTLVGHRSSSLACSP